MNTQDLTQPTKNLVYALQRIADTIILELQQATFGTPGDIFCMDTLFPAYANEVALDTLMA